MSDRFSRVQFTRRNVGYWITADSWHWRDWVVVTWSGRHGQIAVRIRGCLVRAHRSADTRVDGGRRLIASANLAARPQLAFCGDIRAALSVRLELCRQRGLIANGRL